MYDFDKIIDRRGTNSYKWDALNEFYGRDDLLSMWVADMDFESPPIVVEAMRKKLNHKIFGYTLVSDSLKESVKNWLLKRHNWEANLQDISITPGVVPAVNFAIRAFSHPGDKVVVQTPVYYPFFSAIENSGRRIVENPLIYKDGRYTMDLKDLKSKIDDRTKILILCNPHNPVGRVYDEKELKALADVCIENDLLIVSDEIHSDIIRRGYKHIPIASLSDRISDSTISCYSTSKTFNLAGLQTSAIIIKNKRLKTQFDNYMDSLNIFSSNLFGLAAMEAAYNYVQDWLEELLDYLENNHKFVEEFFAKNFSEVKVVKAEGTYLVWLDFSGLKMNQNDLNDTILNKAKVALVNGVKFGANGKGFMRLNIACPLSVLEEGLNRIVRAFKN